MYKMCGAAFVLLAAVSVAQGHFPFIVPEDGGTAAKVVFSDSLEPDTNVNIEKLANTKLTLRDPGGKEVAIEWKKGDGFYALDVPGKGTRVVYGVTDYGVLQKGDAKPFKLTYYPKAVFGKAIGKEAVVGEKLPLEIAVTGEGKVRFQVLKAGKPLPDAEVSVMTPSSGKKDVKTDKDGFTPEFSDTGRYGVTAKLIEAKSGEHAGKKYDEIRHYATLVCFIWGK